jgi:spore coat protein CotF
MRTMTEEFVERARKEGQEKQARMVKAAMKNFHISFDQACEKFEIPKEDRPELEKLIRSM